MVGLIILVVVQLFVYSIVLGIYYDDYLTWGINSNNTPKTTSEEYKSLKGFKNNWPLWYFFVPFLPLGKLCKVIIFSVIKMIKEIKEL